MEVSGRASEGSTLGMLMIGMVSQIPLDSEERILALLLTSWVTLDTLLIFSELSFLFCKQD
jgi:hypothetical protein